MGYLSPRKLIQKISCLLSVGWKCASLNKSREPPKDRLANFQSLVSHAWIYHYMSILRVIYVVLMVAATGLRSEKMKWCNTTVVWIESCAALVETMIQSAGRMISSNRLKSSSEKKRDIRRSNMLLRQALKQSVATGGLWWA